MLLFGRRLLWHILTFIRSLQMIVHLPLLRVVLPSSVIYFFRNLLPIALWDFFYLRTADESELF